MPLFLGYWLFNQIDEIENVGNKPRSQLNSEVGIINTNIEFMKKRQVFIIAFLIASTSIYAQKCKPAVLNVDELTEQKVEGWGGKLGSSRNLFQGVSQNLNFYIGSVDGKKYAEITVQYTQKGNDASVNEIDIPKGSVFRLRTGEGIITLSTDKSQKIKRKAAGYLITGVSLTAELTEEQLESLSNNLITMYRIEPEDSEPINGDVNEKTANKLMEQFNCFNKKA